MRALLVTAVLAVASLLPVPGVAGTTGALVGTVTDAQSGAPVAGAQVTATSPAQRERSVSDASGHFVFVSLTPNTYVVTAMKKGYQPISYPDVRVSADSSTTLAVSAHPAIRIVAIIDGPWMGSTIVRLYDTADGYTLRPEMPFYSFDGHDIYALHFVPGVTFGAGPVLSR
jgi:hypothetical protein